MLPVYSLVQFLRGVRALCVRVFKIKCQYEFIELRQNIVFEVNLLLVNCLDESVVKADYKLFAFHEAGFGVGLQVEVYVLQSPVVQTSCHLDILDVLYFGSGNVLNFLWELVFAEQLQAVQIR